MRKQVTRRAWADAPPDPDLGAAFLLRSAAHGGRVICDQRTGGPE